MNRQNNSSSDVSSIFLSSMTTIFETRFDRWNAANLEFFDSAYEEKIIATAKSIQHANKNTYFRDVHLFIDRTKDIALVKDYDTVRNNLYICFRKQVMMWYTAEMSNEKKELIKIDNNLNVWERYLVKKFRERSNVAMITITKEKYIMNDARRRRESREYVDVIMRIARFVELDIEAHQIMLIYNDLNLKFQRNVSMSELTTKIQNFLQCLNDKKNIWWRIANRTRNSYNIYIKSYSDQSTYDQFRAYSQSEQQSHDQYDFQRADQRFNQWNFINSYRFSYQYEANQTYQSQSQFFSNARQLNAFKQSLQITVDSSNEFAFTKSNSFRFNDNITFQSNQERYERSNRFFERAWNYQEQRNVYNQKRRNIYNQSKTQEAYTDATEKNKNIQNYQRNYQNQDADSSLNEVDKKNENRDQIEDDAESFNQDQKYHYFLNEKEYHIDIEIITQRKCHYQCRKCKVSFFLNNKLHRHIRDCRREKIIKSVDAHQTDAFHLHDDIERIIVFKVKLDLSKDLTFRFWHFATFHARICNDSIDELCADSECIMSLINRDYLMQILSQITIHRTEASIIVRDIDIATHSCSEYVVWIYSSQNRSWKSQMI
jgi:hypothetical protein